MRKRVSVLGLLEATAVVLLVVVFIVETGVLIQTASRVAFADRGSAHASDFIRDGGVTP